MARVLVVEDDAAIGRALHTALQAHGHSVYWVQTGSAAVGAAVGESFDLVLLDLGVTRHRWCGSVPKAALSPAQLCPGDPDRPG